MIITRFFLNHSAPIFFEKSLMRIIIGIILIIASTYGQNTPFRTHVAEEELVSFQPSASFAQAIQILSQMATKYEGKVVIDPTNQKGPINIAIPPTHWRQALETLLKANGLEFAERATYYEIRKTSDRPKPSLSAVIKSKPTPEKEVGLGINTREVEISAIFFQGDRRSLAEAGIDWAAIVASSNDTIDILSIAASNVSQELFSIGAKHSGSMGNTAMSLIAVLQAFEALNIGEIIAQPSIKVMNGITGRIQVGQQFSIKQKDFAGNTVESFFDVGTILEVTPQVITDQDITFIHLIIESERSAAYPDALSTRIDKQTAKTQVLLLDGEQTVIGGLFSEESSEVRKGIPILKDLPWWLFGLRYLAGFNSSDIIKKELIIIIKAELVPSLVNRQELKRDDLDQLIRKSREKFKQKSE